MKKLNLDLDDLHVESFDTTADANGPRGTVQAHNSVDTCDITGCEASCGTCYGVYTCIGYNTCEQYCTLYQTCEGSGCWGSCYPEVTCYGPRCGPETDPSICIIYP